MLNSRHQNASNIRRFRKSQVEYVMNQSPRNIQKKSDIFHTKQNDRHSNSKLQTNPKTKQKGVRNLKEKTNQIVLVNPMEASSDMYMRVVPSSFKREDHFVDNYTQRDEKNGRTRNSSDRHKKITQHFTGAVRKIVINNKTQKEKSIICSKKRSLIEKPESILPTNAFVHILSAFISNNFENNSNYGSLSRIKTLSMTLEDVPEENDSEYENSFAKPAISFILRSTHEPITSIISKKNSLKMHGSFILRSSQLDLAIENSKRGQVLKCQKCIENDYHHSKCDFKNINNQKESNKQLKIQEKLDSNDINNCCKQIENICDRDELRNREEIDDEAKSNSLICKAIDDRQSDDNLKKKSDKSTDIKDISKEDLDLHVEKVDRSTENSLHVILKSQSHIDRQKESVFRGTNIAAQYSYSDSQLTLNNIRKHSSLKEFISISNIHTENCRNLSKKAVKKNKDRVITLFMRNFQKHEHQPFLKNSTEHIEELRKPKGHSGSQNFQKDVVDFLTKSVENNSEKLPIPEGEKDFLVMPSAKLRIPHFSQILPDIGKETRKQINRFLTNQRFKSRKMSLNVHNVEKELVCLYKRKFP
ncbi:hypothetical protein HHI36_019489 [Cryptolaemus montrouzieri]|uniref:Uncharacterized protein n=1 Tax=Cryptolaemus montrouzieri TaxID=559131 RepID=A0ABD2P3T3_9CUCU